MQVAPSSTGPPAAAAEARTWSSYMESHMGSVILLGCMYIGLSLTATVWYTSLVRDSFANDIWLADYDAHTHQALLVDIFNVVLATRSTGAVDILAPEAAIANKDYRHGRISTTSVYPTYVRRVVLNDLTTVEYAVENLRSVSAFWSLWMYTQYCWVDLGHEFELAHTSKRQQRCSDQYVSNGAVYMETVLRNQDWEAFVEANGNVFFVAIQSWLEHSASGRAWLADTATARHATSVLDEVAYWKQHSISSFQLQWLNYYQTGLSESLDIENALGMRVPIVLKDIAHSDEAWTSVFTYWMPINDVTYIGGANLSMIRSADNAYQDDPTFDLESVLGLQDSNGEYQNQTRLLRTHFGPLLSIDTVYVAVPGPLLALHHAVVREIYGAARTVKGVEDGLVGPAYTFFPTPSKWTSLDERPAFHGGNPCCLNQVAQPFVQESFGFYDNCGSQPPLAASATPISTLFAAISVHSSQWPTLAARVCSHTTPTADCVAHVTSTLALANLLPSAATSGISGLVDAAAASLAALNIGLIQFASTTETPPTDWKLLFQPLLDNDDEEWTFWGWIMLCDWIQGSREVVSFEGDNGVWALVSAADSPQVLPTNVNTVDTTSLAVYWLVAYTTIVLVGVGVGVFLFILAIRRATYGPNLFQFNRIVGSTWIGRPLMLCRGFTALCMLSTAQIAIASATTARFELAPRPLVQTMILTGEATWVLYVAIDVLTLAVQGRTCRLYAPLSCGLAWAVMAGVETVLPIHPEAFLARKCTAKDMAFAVQCTSGVLKLGDYRRVLLLLAIQGLSLVASLAVVGIIFPRQPSKSRRTSTQVTRHILGVADTFLKAKATTRPSAHTSSGQWSLDNASCFMAGLVSLSLGSTTLSFDVKLWHLQCHRRPGTVAPDPSKHRTFSFYPTRPLAMPPLVMLSFSQLQVSATSAKTRWRQMFQGAARWAFGGVYAIGAIVASLSYLQVSQVNLANDLFWANFNMTGPHAFVANWANRQLILGLPTNHSSTTFSLNASAINQDGRFDKDSTVVASPANFGAVLQYTELSSLDATVRGLRQSDACQVPWILTQYCFVDFGQRWELANSAARQTRCKTLASNGAVFLETVLRNVEFGEFAKCWGDAFDVAIGNELRQSTNGQQWLNSVAEPFHNTVEAEVSLWQLHGILEFVTQWQNFKRIGVTSTYTTLTAFGTSFSLTLQHQNPAFQIMKQTSYKMYWGLANDLTAVLQNATGIGGRSLVRGSPLYAYANATAIESVLYASQTLVAPLANSFSLLRDTVGPFGSVDMWFVSCPLPARRAIQTIMSQLRTALARDILVQEAYDGINDATNIMLPAPKAWTDLDFYAVGGSPLCPQFLFSSAGSISTGLVMLFSWDMGCTPTATWASLFPSREFVVVASVLANVTAIGPTCVQNIQYVQECSVVLNQTMSLRDAYLESDAALVDTVVQARESIRALNVEFLQFGKADATAPLTMYRLNALDETQVEFEFYSWLYLLDWAVGWREVVSFQGDVGTVTLLSEYLRPLAQQLNDAQPPRGTSVYLQLVVGYVTVMLIVLATTALVYACLNRGHIEVLNLLELQRVGAVVWVGRPLLFIRSFTAIGLLSTCNLQLVSTGYITSFQVVKLPWYKTMLAAKEVTWLVAVVNDIAMVATREYTSYYVTIHCVMVWLFAAIWSVLYPVDHSMTLQNKCRHVQVDSSVVCDSGVLTIGDASRVGVLVAMVPACNLFCYVATRIVFGLLQVPPTRSKVHSIWLYAGAKYLYFTAKWEYDQVYYMDRMSAALNGLLVYTSSDVVYGLDIKLWHTFRAPVPRTRVPRDHPLAACLQYTVPLQMQPRQELPNEGASAP